MEKGFPGAGDGDVFQNEMDQIASQMPSWEDEANIHVESGDEDNDGPEIGAGAWEEGVWQDPLDPHPLPLRERHSTMDFDPDYNPNSSEMATTGRRAKVKKRRGERGRNQYPEGKWRVDVVSPAGEPTKPPMVRSKEILDPSISDWLLVPGGRKEAMWELLKQTFILPTLEELRKQVKHYTRKQLGEVFRRWSGELNDKYVKKGPTPFNEYGSITPAQWDEFIRQKTSPEALALNQRIRELVLSNIHKVHLRPGGYRGKIDKWWHDKEATIAAGQPNPFEGLDERGWQWLAARKHTIVYGKPTFSTPETNQVAKNIYDLFERQRKGEFVSNRDKDVLSSRGFLELSMKDGFERDRASYNSHSHYKEYLREAVEKALQTRFKDFLLATLVEQQQSGEANIQMPMVMMSHPLQGQADTPVYAPSSVGSMIAQPNPIDSICISTPWSLHIPVGRAGKTKEVAKGLAIPVGGLFEGKPIPRYYACVTVLEINSNYGDHKTYIPTAKGVHCLGQSVGNTILWYKRDIILSSVPSEHALVDSTPPGGAARGATTTTCGPARGATTKIGGPARGATATTG
uniref:DUF8039 domain-containing protein n=1 Tax=Setaria viridis TaxID=4556 RepID=A0A4U6V8A7_SETVI|nr:hypothetical protein SEVIR_3G123500v2 [Setaria viridis]